MRLLDTRDGLQPIIGIERASTRLGGLRIGMRELRPVRMVGIPHTAVEMPPRGSRMVRSERTAEHDTVLVLWYY